VSFSKQPIATAIAAALMLISPATQASDAEADALDLVSAPEPDKKAPDATTRLFAEAALGSVSLRHGAGSRSLRRASIDVYHASRLSPAWRMTLSDRLDHLHPTSLMQGSDTVNSLREAYLGWDGDDGKTAVEFGRINLRQGPAYGFNPTDFFRDGASRVLTSVNPFSIRENRLGTVMLRVQHLWDGGALSLALAPKLANGPSANGLSLDLGATNNRNRSLLSFSRQFAGNLNMQALLYKEPGLRTQLGASLTALIGNATVAHAEWSNAEEPSLVSRSSGRPDPVRSGNRVAAGLTYTTPGKLSLTAELHSNSFAAGESAWAAGSGAAERGMYLLTAEQRQDSAARRGALLYVTQKDLAGIRNLALAGFVRFNIGDHSRLHWAEVRYQWRQTDLALQWQLSTGQALSQYGLMPERQSIQILATHHFQ